MKSAKLYLILNGFSTMLSSFGGNRQKDQVEAVATSEEKPSPTSVIYLEGMYATSTQLPLKEFSLRNIFDSKAETFWSTTKGAAPDEGFVLYFPSKMYVKEIELVAPADTSLATINSVSVYAD